MCRAGPYQRPSRRRPISGTDFSALREVARERRSVCKGATAEQRLIDVGRWLRYLGWWRVPTAELRFQGHSNTMWPGCAMNADSARQPSFNGGPRFATSCSGSSAPIGHFSALDPSDVDVYLVTEGARRWSRVSTSGIAAALRVFWRYMARCGECQPTDCKCGYTWGCRRFNRNT